MSLDRSHPAAPLSAGVALGPVTCAHLDVRDCAEVEAVARELVAAGLEPDIVVNSAGLASDAPV